MDYRDIRPGERFEDIGNFNLFQWFERFLSPEALQAARDLGIILIIIFIAGIIWVLPKLWQFRPKFKRTAPFAKAPQEKFAKRRWEEIAKRAEGEKESDLSLAIIEADNLLDDILKRIGFQGDTMAERMSHITETQLSTLTNLREAHRVRNNIAHTPGFKITPPEARRILQKYRKVLEELEMI
jgi:hypothetical protein